MRNCKKTLIIYLFLLFTLSIFAQANNNNNLQLTPQEKAWLKKHPIIKAHNDQNYAPFNFLEFGEVKGYTIDMLNLMAKKLDIKIEYVSGHTWAEYIEMIKNKQIDLVGNILITDKRKEFIEFSDPILIHSSSIISRTDFPIQNLSQLKGKTVSVVKGWWHEEALKKEYPNIKLLLVDEPIDALKAVSHGLADATLNSGASAHYLWLNNNISNLSLSGDPKLLGAKEPIEHIGVRKDWPLLVSALNKAMKSISFDEKQKLKRKWMFTHELKKTKLQLSEEEQNYLDNKTHISVMSFENFQPFSFRQNGEPKGYSIETMKLISKLINKEIRFIKKPWNEQLQMLKEGKLDVIPHIAVTKERKAFVSYTNFIHITFLIGFATSKDFELKSMDDLKGKKLAVVKGYYLHEHLKNNFKDLELLLTKSNEEAIQAVAEGRADAVVDNIPTLNYFIQEKWLSNLKIANVNDFGMPMQTDLPMGVNKNNLVLKSILEKANSAIPREKFTKLKQTWMSQDIDKTLNELNEKEKNFLKEKPIIKFLIRKNRPPFDFTQNNEAKGLAVDYLKLIGEKLGFKAEFIAKNIGYKEYSNMLIENTDEFDTVAFMVKNKQREKLFSFGTDYLSYPLMIITHKNAPYIGELSNLNGKNVVIEKNYLTNNWIKRDYPQINIIPAKNTIEALNMTNEEKVDAYIGNLGITNYMIVHGELNNLKIAAPTEYKNVNFSFVSPKNMEYLSSILTKGYNQITPNEHNSIQQKWFSAQTIEKIDYKLVWQIILISIFIFIWFTWWNRKTQQTNKKLDNLNKKMEGYIELIDNNIITSTTDLDGNITEVSKAFCEVSGFTKKELIGQNHRIIYHPDMNKDIYEELWETITKGEIWKGEIKNKNKSGSYYWVDTTITPIYDLDGKKIAYTAIRQDITDKKIIEKLSITDGLTNIYNRRHFNELFPRYINSAKRNNELISFFIMDIDYFKQYNDTYGHQMGDKVLIKVAQELKESLNRADDYCFRLGGEEFGVIFKPRSKDDAIRLATKIKNKIENLKIEHKQNTTSKYVTTSIGLIIKNASDIKNEEQIYKEADDLLYKAKDAGRNKIIM